MQIPLFPLHAVLTPGLALPLHVFEERYRAMVRRCLDTSSPFGIVLIREGSEVLPRRPDRELAIAGVGTFAEIREASRYSDGRWDLLAVGSGRFAIDEVHSELEPYLVADVRALDDEIGDADAADRLVQRVIGRFVEYLHLLQPEDGEAALPIDVQVEVEVPEPTSGEEPPPGTDAPVDEVFERGAPDEDPVDLATTLRIPDDPSQLSFLLAGIVQVDPVRKQALLEADSAEDRLRDLDRLLDRELLLLRRRLAPYVPERPAGVSRAN
jgi:Lon protease-like protein